MEASKGHGPVVERALLTAELRRLRLAAGKRQQDAAQACEWSVSKLIRIENGTSPVTKPDLEALLRYYGVGDDERTRELTTRARAARQKGWWEDFELDDKAFITYVGYEYGASTIRVSESLVVPGQLQVPEYTEAVLGSFKIPSQVIQRVLAFRRERQHQLAERSPEQIYILDEAILTRPAQKVMPAQLHHLIEIASRSTVTIQVIPRERGYHFGLRGPFTLLGFDVPLNEVLYVENTLQGDLLISETEEQARTPRVPAVADPGTTLTAHIEGFEALQRIALGPDESLKHIKNITRELS